MIGYAKNSTIYVGFTIIELLVAVSVFTLSLTVMAGSVVSTLRAQQQAQDSIRSINQASYAIEYIGRVLRMAKKDLAGQCLGQIKDNYSVGLLGDSVRFLNYRNQFQEFFLDSTDKIKVRFSSDANAANFGLANPLTSTQLEVTRFKVVISGQSQDDELQPVVTFLTEIKPRNSTGPRLVLQTSVSQRNLDIKR